MARKSYFLFFFCFVAGLTMLKAGNGTTGPTMENIILFPGAPSPTTDKCLIRTYLPESDPNASLRILNKDSTLFKEISLNGEFGVNSTPINVSDWQAGVYLYQLFYKGEARKTLSFEVKH